jgi:pimeloyl-ACP methyl ester carboxylesterase
MYTHEGIADVNGTHLYYELAGSGDPLVLIHGNTLDTRMWDDQFEPLARRYQVIRYDMRGYGKSALPTADSYAPADDLMALLRHLRLGSAHILGQSRGGAVAIDFALTYPEATDTLTVVDTVLRGFQWKAFGTSLSEIHSAGKTSGIEAARQRWLDDAMFAPALEKPRVATRLRQMVADYSGWLWINSDTIRLLDPPSIQQLDTINIPTLVIVGERDLPDFHEIAEILHHRIPHASKVVMQGVGHMSNMEDPERFNDIVLGFLADK